MESLSQIKTNDNKRVKEKNTIPLSKVDSLNTQMISKRELERIPHIVKSVKFLVKW